MLKCPKCTTTIKLPGKGAAPAAPASASEPARAASSPSPSRSSGASAPPPSPSAASASASPPPPPPSVESAAGSPPVALGERALVSFPSQAETTTIATVLSRLGFTVDALEGAEDRHVRLQQGDYAFVASTRNGPSRERDVYALVKGLSPDRRRRLFLLLIGDEFRSGEPNQAFAAGADLVLHPDDVPSSARLVSQLLTERKRLFQTFLDAEDRKAEGRL